jgi:hypothetical protein
VFGLAQDLREGRPPIERIRRKGRIVGGFSRSIAVVSVLSLVAPAGRVAAQGQDVPLEARIWLDRGEEPTLRRGESARLYYRASRSAHVAIFQIDTNGTVRMVFPRSPDENHFVRGGVDYRLLFARSSFWQVDEDPGVGYFFLVASPEPFDFTSFRYSRLDRGWDVSLVAREVYRDPYVAMDEYVAALIPDWQDVPYALDFVTYNVDRPYEYPRFLCYDCHGFRPFAVWNPYVFGCSEFRVVIYDDPYYYPARRYRGDRVVFVRPTQPFQPRFAFKERTSAEPTTPLRQAAEQRTTAGIGSGAAGGGVRSPVSAAPDPQPTRPGGVPGQRGFVSPPISQPRGQAGGGEPQAGRQAVPRDDQTRPVLQPRPAPQNVPARPGSRPAAPSTGGAARPEVRPEPTSSSGGASTPPPAAAPRRPPPTP